MIKINIENFMRWWSIPSMKSYLKLLLLVMLLTLSPAQGLFADETSDKSSNIDKINVMDPLNKEVTRDELTKNNNNTTDNEEKQPAEIDSEDSILEGGKSINRNVEEEEATKWYQGEYATGYWGGARKKLEDHGITLGVTYYAEPFFKVSGGLTNHSKMKYLGLVDYSVTFDTEKLGLWKGGTAYISGANLHGHALTEQQVGDIQSISSIDARGFTKLSEFWYEQSFLDDRFKIKIGKQDGNADFSITDVAENYINSSFTLNPTIPIPTYPEPALGVQASARIYKGLTIKSAVYDGSESPGQFGFKTAFDREDGTFVIVEPSIEHNIKNMPGKYMFGYWHHTGDMDEITLNINPRNFNSHYGFYAGFSQMVFKENKDEEDSQGLTFHGQFGYTPGDRSEISHFYSSGLSYQGLIPHRNEDFIGIGFATADLSKNLKITENKTVETALEVFYRIQLTPFLAIQPDLQFIFNPYGIEKNALAIGVRTIINF